MARTIRTKQDIAKYVIGRSFAALAIVSSVLPVLIIVDLGTDLSKTVPVRQVMSAAMATSALLSVTLTALFSLRSAVLLRDLASTRAELLRLSHTDDLTGLLNRRGFEHMVQPLIDADADIAVVMCDIDRFKMINDRYGHDQGDAVLRSTAAALADFSQSNGAIVSRYGGEEFVILLHGARVLTSEFHAEQVRRLCLRETSCAAGTIQVSVSVGLAHPDSRRPDLNRLIAKADSAMYLAKASGRNCVRKAAACFGSGFELSIRAGNSALG